MSLTNLNLADIKRITALIEKKESIQLKIAQLNSELESITGGGANALVKRGKATKAKRGRKSSSVKKTTAKAKAAKTSPKKAPKKVATRSGGLKDTILKILKDAKQPLKVAAIAEQGKLKKSSVGVWLFTTGKKIKEVQKAGRGLWKHRGQ